MSPWTIAHEAPLSMGFSSQEYWNRLPFPTSGDLSHPGTEPRSPTLQPESLPSEPPGKDIKNSDNTIKKTKISQIHMHIADSLCCTAETNTTLYSNNKIIKSEKKKKKASSKKRHMLYDFIYRKYPQ